MTSEGSRRHSAGWGSGLLGVLIFSGSLPATRVAVADFSPLFLTGARAVIAALLGAVFLFVLREARPKRADLVPLTLVAIGVVVGFPLLTALALQHIDAAHSVVFVGLLPLSTAIFGVLRGGSLQGDLLMIAAIVVCGLGYAEGATLSRRLGGWQVICWALLLSLPLMGAIALFTLPHAWDRIGAPAWAGLAYVSVFSMMIGFVFWYRGLALGGIAGVGQLQLLQPFFGLLLAGLLLGEPVAWTMIASTVVVVFCVAGAKRFA